MRVLAPEPSFRHETGLRLGSRRPVRPHVPDVGGTAKTRVKSGFVSPVSSVSPSLRLLREEGRRRMRQPSGAVSALTCRAGRCGETGETSAKVARFFGETTRARHT